MGKLNLAIPSSYGELYEWESDGTPVDIISGGTYYKWPTMTVGLETGGDFVVGSGITDDLTIGTKGGGIYRCSYSVGFSGFAGTELRWGLFVNDIRQDKFTFLRNMPGAPHIAPSSLTVNIGTINSGDISSVARAEGDDLIIDEDNTSTPGFDIEFTFTNINSPPHHIHFYGYYTGSAAHDVEAKLWNYNTSSWDDLRADLRDFPDDTNYYLREFGVEGIPSDYLSSGKEVKFQIYHTTGGSPGHEMLIAKLALHQRDSDLMAATDGILSLVPGDRIDLRVTSEEDGAIVTVYNANVAISRIGK